MKEDIKIEGKEKEKENIIEDEKNEECPKPIKEEDHKNEEKKEANDIYDNYTDLTSSDND